MWIKVGWLDEEVLPSFYWEDVDLSYRALKRGYELFWHPRARVVHHHETTMSRINKRYRNRMQERNHLLFIWKNITSRKLLLEHVVGLLNRIVKHPGYLLVFFMAIVKLRKVMRARRKEKKESIVADEFIFSSFKQ